MSGAPDRPRRRYPRDVGGLTVVNAAEERLINEARAARRAGDQQRERLARAELAGRLAARSTVGRATSSVAGGANYLGGGDWFFDTAIHAARAMGMRGGGSREERRALRRGLREGMRESSPYGYYGGAILTGAGTGGAVAARAASAVPGLALRTGQPLTNVGRSMALSATAEAPAAAARAVGNVASGDTSIGEAAQRAAGDIGLAAGAGGAITGLAQTTMPVLRGFGRTIGGFDREGADLLARRTARARQNTRAPANVRVARAREAEEATGTALRAGSSLDEIDAREVAQLARRDQGATAALAEGAENEAWRLQEAFQGGVERAVGRTPSVDAADLSKRASTFANQAMQRLGSQTVRLDPRTVAILRSPGVSEHISRIADPDTGTSSTDELLDAIVAAGGGGGPVDVPLRLVENIRAGLSNLSTIAKPGDNPEALRKVARHLRTTAGDQVPEYEEYLTQYARRRSRVGSGPTEGGETRATGFQAGRRALVENPYTFRAARNAESGTAQMGRREGTASIVREAAARSPQAALTLADRVTRPTTTIARNVREGLGHQPAETLATSGRAVTRAADAQRALSPDGFPVTGAEIGRQGGRATQAAAAYAASGTRLGWPSAIREMIDWAAVPPGVAQRLARALSSPNPADAQRILQRLDDAGLNIIRAEARNTVLTPTVAAVATPTADAPSAETQQPAMEPEPAPVAPTPPAGLSSADILKDLEARAIAAANEGAMDVAQQHLELHDRLANLEAMALEAANGGDMEGAKALLSEYDQIVEGRK